MRFPPLAKKNQVSPPRRHLRTQTQLRGLESVRLRHRCLRSVQAVQDEFAEKAAYAVTMLPAAKAPPAWLRKLRRFIFHNGPDEGRHAIGGCELALSPYARWLRRDLLRIRRLKKRHNLH